MNEQRLFPSLSLNIVLVYEILYVSFMDVM